MSNKLEVRLTPEEALTLVRAFLGKEDDPTVQSIIGKLWDCAVDEDQWPCPQCGGVSWRSIVDETPDIAPGDLKGFIEFHDKHGPIRYAYNRAEDSAGLDDEFCAEYLTKRLTDGGISDE